MSARNARATYLAAITETGETPEQRIAVTVGQAVESYNAWAENENKDVTKHYSLYALYLKAKLHHIPLADITSGLLTAIKGELVRTLTVILTSFTCSYHDFF